MLQDKAYCNYPFQGNPPCAAAASILSITNAARSRHPGGVNVGMADGSVRFVKNSINLFTWRALSTTQGSEVSAATRTEQRDRADPACPGRIDI